MNNTFKKTVAILHLLARNTVGNGEVVGTLVAVGVAVTAGAVAVNSIGTQAKSTGSKQAGNIGQLPGN